MRISIEGIGVLGGFGCGLDDLEKALSTRETVPGNTSLSSPDGVEEIPVLLADTSPLEQFTSKRSLRRIDHLSKMALLGAYLALRDAGQSEASGEGLGTVMATGYGATRTTFGFLDSVIEEGDFLASPTLFSGSVHNAAAANVSILLKATGPSLTITGFEMSVPAALLSACLWLEEGRVDRVLFGGVDEYGEVLGYCRQRLLKEGCNGTGRPPVWAERIPAGEGAAFFLLARDNGDSSGYGTIIDVRTGTMKSGKPVPPTGAVLVLRTHGTGDLLQSYTGITGPGTPVAVYSPLYGDLPVGPAFDMAIAALAMKRDRLFASAEWPGRRRSWNVVREDQALGSRPVCCLTCSGEEIGMITLAERPEQEQPGETIRATR